MKTFIIKQLKYLLICTVVRKNLKTELLRCLSSVPERQGGLEVKLDTCGTHQPLGTRGKVSVTVGEGRGWGSTTILIVAAKIEQLNLPEFDTGRLDGSQPGN